MDTFQREPLKIYIQDIFRAKQFEENKFIYRLFDLYFKNILIHGVVTSLYNTTEKTTNLELCDPTGCVQIYYDANKTNNKTHDITIKDLIKSFSGTSRSCDVNILTMSSLLNYIENNHNNCINFTVGSHLSVIGDIFMDEFKNTRMICAYSCKTTSIDREIVWLEELKYLYNKYYVSRRNIDS